MGGGTGRDASVTQLTIDQEARRVEPSWNHRCREMRRASHHVRNRGSSRSFGNISLKGMPVMFPANSKAWRDETVRRWSDLARYRTSRTQLQRREQR